MTFDEKAPLAFPMTFLNVKDKNVLIARNDINTYGIFLAWTNWRTGNVIYLYVKRNW